MKKLKGTEKQIKYANDIRNTLINLFDELKEASALDVNEKWESFKDSKKEKFGTKENLIEQRKEKINKVKENILEIEESRIIIENYKEVMQQDKFNQIRSFKEIAEKQGWNKIITATIQKIQNSNRGKW